MNCSLPGVQDGPANTIALNSEDLSYTVVDIDSTYTHSSNFVEPILAKEHVSCHYC